MRLGSLTKTRKRGGRTFTCVPYRRLRRRPFPLGPGRSSRSSWRKRFSPGVGMRDAWRAKRSSTRSKSLPTPRRVLAETATTGGRWRSRASRRGRTSSIPTVATSHFERTTSVEQPAERVHEARLADVRAAEHGDPDGLLTGLGGPLPGERGDDRVEEVAGAVAVERRDGQRLAGGGSGGL